MWVSLNSGNFLLKHRNEGTQEFFFVTDLVNIWKCVHSSEALLSIFKGCNKAFQWPDNNTAITQVVALFSKESSNIKRTVESEGSHLIVTSSSSISVYSYKMSLRFEKMPAEVLYQEFTYFLLALLNSYQERERRLVKIVESKDVELEEYRQEGLEIKRRGVVTAPFGYDAFNNSITEFSAEDPLTNPADLFNAALQQQMSKLPQFVVKPPKEELMLQEIQPVTENNVPSEGSSLYLDSPSEIKVETVAPKKRKKAFVGLKL